MMVRELGFEMKAQPSEKMKTPEELAKEEKEKLQKLEVTELLIFTFSTEICSLYFICSDLFPGRPSEEDDWRGRGDQSAESNLHVCR